MCWLVILIPMILCLIVIYYLFGFTVIYYVCEYGWFKLVELKWLRYIFLYFIVAIDYWYHVCCFCLEDIVCSVLVWTSHTHDSMSHFHMLFVWGYYDIYSICEYGWFKMVELKWLGYIFFTLMLLLIIDIMYVAFALKILSALYWFNHLILIKICLIDICFYTVD